MKDFTTLKQPRKEKETNNLHLRKISATQLFTLREKGIANDKNGSTTTPNHLQRTFSQPNLPRTETTQLNSQFYTPSFARRSETMSGRNLRKPKAPYQRNHFSRQLKTCEKRNATSENMLNSSKIKENANYENLYDLIQKKLKCYDTEPSTSCPEDITDPLNINSDTFLQEGWDESIKMLADCGRLDSDLLEAIYLLRNAHKRGFFQEHEAQNEVTDSSGETVSLSSRSTSINDDESLNTSQCSLASTALPSSTIYSSSSEGTPVNSSAASSGRSTPSVRRRPRRPEIKISKYNRNYEDYIEIRRPDSICSIDSEFDGSVVSDCSVLDIPNDIIAQAVMKTQLQRLQNNELHEFEETLKDEDKEIQMYHLTPESIESLCNERPGSPTSEFLKSLSHADTDITQQLHLKLSPLLHRLQKLEDDSKKLSSLQVKLAVLQEEKRQLSVMLEQKRQSCRFCSNLTENCCCVDPQVETSEGKYKDIGVQKDFEIVTEISHKETFTNTLQVDSIGVGDNIADIQYTNSSTQNCINASEFSCQSDISLSNCSVETETIQPQYTDSSMSTELLVSTTSTQSETSSVSSKQHMTGASYTDMIDCGVGDKQLIIDYNSQETQVLPLKTSNQAIQNVTQCSNQSSSVGCSVSELNDSSVQFNVEQCDFTCGENKAYIQYKDAATESNVTNNDASTTMEVIKTSDAETLCNIRPLTETIAVGDGRVDDILCDRCSNLKTNDISVGCYTDDTPCSISDKLCDCQKPDTQSLGVGECTVTDICCDRCENLDQTSIGVGDCQIDDLLCDKCATLKTTTVGVSDDTINDLMCDTCSIKGLSVDVGVGEDYINNMTSIGVGDVDVNDTDCEKCKQNKDDSIFNFDLNIINRPVTPSKQQASLCSYCGNKVDLNDTNFEDSLQAMRENMESISCGMKRTTASRGLNLDLESPEHGFLPSHHQHSQQRSKSGSVESPMSDDCPTPLSEEEGDDGKDTIDSGRNDVIEACKKLHQHFSGEKTMKQAKMLKYMGIIQKLWFQAVNRRRANASVVKSYIDLFRQRIPELMETIINLTDDEGNTSLHYAITYKNYGVVNILLDTGECAVDLVNQAGYSPIMLAALTGFEKKNDKYVMQRLFRMGDTNKESADTGQTSLMLAVSRGNLGTVELLLDAGCDINATDDEGSTALMCACEHGNINIVKCLLGNPECDATVEDNEGSTALSIAMDSRRKDLALLIYGSLNFDTRGRIKLSPSKQSLLGLGRRSPSPVIGRR